MSGYGRFVAVEIVKLIDLKEKWAFSRDRQSLIRHRLVDAVHSGRQAPEGAPFARDRIGKISVVFRLSRA